MMKINATITIPLLFITLVMLSGPAMASDKIVAVSADRLHTLALGDDGSVWEWGDNRGGQLGIPGKTPQYTPIRVPITNVTAISAGSFVNLALKDDGTVWAWGRLDFIVANTPDNFTLYKIPIQDVKAVYAGPGWWYTVKTDGTVWAWGANSAGHVGDGTYTDKLTPVLINITDVGFIDGRGTFAVKNDGTVWAWGDNTYTCLDSYAITGALGDFSENKSRPFPFKVDMLSNVKSIAKGGEATLVLKNDGSVWAWGSDYYGQLGDGNKTYETMIIKGDQCSVYNDFLVKSKIDRVKAISTGHCLGMALKEDHTVWVWGSYAGVNGMSTPAKVQGLNDIIQISAGAYHCVALKQDGSVWSWGNNEFGQIGGGPAIYKLTPVKVEFDEGNVIEYPVIITSNTSANNVGSNTSSAVTPIKNSGGTGYNLSIPSSTLKPASEQQTGQPTDDTILKIIGIIGLILFTAGAAYLLIKK
ncbi:RCC1 domain-containing protein [Methanocella sp. MCL-LM]|uniref:RCC1 domain-containing protein n=1 Tax=Methanocella sp. MCL-LM TaxID=3412035 RepID=UPI003C758FBD